jgi:DNA-binding SARP family transcriptional activator
MTSEIDEEIKNLKIQIATHTRRLNVLKNQRATKGIDTEPQIILEIEDIEAKIAELSEQLTKLEPPKKLLEVTLDEQYTPELVEAARRAFAGVLNISVDLVKVAYLREGSVVLLVQMPEEAANRLIALQESGSLILENLRIKKIRAIDNLARANLQRINLSEFDLAGADLSGADLRRADLRRADLSGADLRGADLRGVYLLEADLSRADLSETDLWGAYLTATNLTNMISDKDINTLIDPRSVTWTEMSNLLFSDPVTKDQKIESQPFLRICYLGPFRVYRDNQLISKWNSLKALSILKYLATQQNNPVPKEFLMDSFWPQADPEAARKNLHQAIYSLRQTLRGYFPEIQPILYKNEHYFLNPGLDVWLDYVEFQKNIEAGQSLEVAGDLISAEVKYGQAIELYKGNFLEEDLYEDWSVFLRENLHNMFLDMLNRLSEYYMKEGRYIDVIMDSQRILALDNIHEEAHRRLMLAHAALGQRNLAIRQYKLYVHMLSAELGVTPSFEMQALYQAILSNQE